MNVARALALAVLCLAPPASASMPVSVRLMTVSADVEQQARARAYAEYLQTHGNFLISTDEPPVRVPTDILACLQKTRSPDDCVRKLMAPREIDQMIPPVVILAEDDGAGRQRWRCIGAADAPFWPEKQAVTIDLRQALFGAPNERAAVRNRALDCILAAGTEANGRIKLSKP